ncbi:MAG: acetyltransferase [Phycisphaerales bacterium]|nr:acetyltransferase [Phycisphaerales bacterium]
MIPIVIFGCGGLGAVARDTLLRARSFEPIGFLTSDRRQHGRIIDHLAVLGGMDVVTELLHGGVEHAIVAIGDNATRIAIADELLGRGMRLGSAIHPLASISATATLSEHLIIGARAIVCANASVAAHSVVSSGSIIEHDNRIGRGVFLHPAVRLAGGVRVDDEATLGVGVCVIPGRRIGPRATIAPGSVVIRDVGENETVGGVPGRVVHSGESRFAPDPVRHGAASIGQVATARD